MIDWNVFNKQPVIPDHTDVLGWWEGEDEPDIIRYEINDDGAHRWISKSGTHHFAPDYWTELNNPFKSSKEEKYRIEEGKLKRGGINTASTTPRPNWIPERTTYFIK